MKISIPDLNPATIAKSIDEAMNSGQLDKEKMIYYKIDEENLEIEIDNSKISKEDLCIKPGSVTLPDSYQSKDGKKSLVDDPIYASALEMHWGF